MEPKPRKIENYATAGGASPVDEWIDDLRDHKTQAIIFQRINRLRLGNFGGCRAVGGGVQEIKIDFGPGYRIYFGVDGEKVILLAAGDKSTQSSDIRMARQRWRDYNA